MSDAGLKFENEGLTILVSQSHGEATIAWRGESGSRNPGDFLTPITTRLVKELRGLSVTIDFSRLEYMNSSTVGPLIACIKSFDGLGAPVLVVFSDEDWQRTHVQCMRTIARTLKNVRIDVRAAPRIEPEPGRK
jgi:anti-anti-sigma regulatory factor